MRFVLGKGRGGGAAGGPQRIPATASYWRPAAPSSTPCSTAALATTSAEIELPDVEATAFLALLR